MPKPNNFHWSEGWRNDGVGDDVPAKGFREDGPDQRVVLVECAWFFQLKGRVQIFLAGDRRAEEHECKEPVSFHSARIANSRLESNRRGSNAPLLLALNFF